MNHEKCANCGADNLQRRVEAETLQYKGQPIVTDVEYSLCPQCGAEAIFPDQIKRNDCRVRDAWRKADGLLTGEEIADLRKKLGLTQQDAAKVFGGGVNAFSKYERGEVIQSEGMDKLMRLALEMPDVSRWLRQHAGLADRPRGDEKQDYDSKVVRFYPKGKPQPLILESPRPGLPVDESDPSRNVKYG
jgi:HTH-type transcriptional regulator/antitoxin MqsA